MRQSSTVWATVRRALQAFIPMTFGTLTLRDGVTSTGRPRVAEPCPAGWAAVARLAMRGDEALALEAAEQGVDRALSDRREPPLAQAAGHLVAVRGLVDDDREEAEVKDSAEHLAAPAFSCHATHGSGN